jgi:hypothetical protein
MALVIGFLLAALIGAYHHFAIRGIDWLKGSEKKRRNTTLLVVFWGLLALHTSEILIYAVAYRGLIEWGIFGELSGEFTGTWHGLIYFSGINFATLGYTQIDTAGSIRMISMMQALLGFMLITWSATFTYTVWQQSFRG